MWDDAKLGLKHLASREKVVVVFDIERVRAAVKVFGLLIPGQIRVFHNQELALAIRWVAE